MGADGVVNWLGLSAYHTFAATQWPGVGSVGDRTALMRIPADQLCVDYNGTVALYDASLRLPEGCICGLVGMNVLASQPCSRP